MNLIWRVVHDPEEIHQYIASGKGFICPAVLGAAGPSKDKVGQFWYRVIKNFGYVNTLEEAKKMVEELNKDWIIKNS
jgi:hypothetical protein